MQHARGFTLVEMLVTLVLVSLVGSLLWQALATVARLESALARTRALGDDDALRRVWAEQALAGIMTGATGDPVDFRGSADGLSGYSTMPPWPGTMGPELTTLALANAGESAQRLMARRPGDAPELELWRWPGRDGRFDYLDADGRWHARWPPAPGRQPSLPRAVRLVGPASGPLLVPVLAVQNPMLRQQDLLPDDVPPR